MKLRTITPIHIGDGEEIIPWEYKKDTGKVGIFPVEHIIKELTNSYSGQRLRNLLLDLRNYVRDFGFSKHLGDFVREHRLNLTPLYSLECKTSLQNGREFKSIKSHIKSVEGVYIPGSEVKGALRTIFIFGLVRDALKKGDERHIKFISEAVTWALDNANDKKVWDKALGRIQNYFFRDKNNKDAQNDLFKAIVISDSRPKPPEEVLYIDSIRLIGSSENFSEPHELIKSDTVFDIYIQIDEEHKRALKKVSHNPYIDKLNLEFLQESAFSFYGFLLEEESKFFQRSNVNIALDDIVKVNDIRKKGDFLLKIGKHQGFLSVTIMLILKKKLPKLYERVYRQVVPKARNELNKTRKITSEERVLGWCVLEGG